MSGDLRRRGLTLVAAILSLLLLLLLVALVASAVWTARGAAKRAACKTNLQKLVSALLLYREGNNGFPPDRYESPEDGVTGGRAVAWAGLVERSVGGDGAFVCPADKTAAEAAASRPPGSRPGVIACSYDYVYWEWQQSQAPDSARGRAGREPRRAPFARSERAGAAPLLVCRHHDTDDGDGAPWGLVAYEDGTVVWEQIPVPAGRGPLAPAAVGAEEGPVTASGTAPRAIRAGSPRTPQRRLLPESRGTSPARPGEGKGRRSHR